MGKNTKKQNTERKSAGSFFARYGYVLLAAVFACVFMFSAIKLAVRFRQTRASGAMTEKTQQAVTYVTPAPTAVPAAEPQETGNPSGETPEPTPVPVPEPERPPIEVDFDYLRAINPDIMGWLYCEDTEINFGVMHASDNEHYLYHLMDDTYNPYGTIFMDYRCSGDFTDANTVIYGHNMQNGTMFGGLKLYRSQEYYDSHSVIYLLTPEQNYRLEPVTGFIHTSYLSMYELPSNKADVEQFLPQALRDSSFVSQYEIQPGDRFVTLSTCADDYNGARYALICRMEKID